MYTALDVSRVFLEPNRTSQHTHTQRRELSVILWDVILLALNNSAQETQVLLGGLIIQSASCVLVERGIFRSTQRGRFPGNSSSGDAFPTSCGMLMKRWPWGCCPFDRECAQVCTHSHTHTGSHPPPSGTRCIPETDVLSRTAVWDTAKEHCASNVPAQWCESFFSPQQNFDVNLQRIS